MLYFSKLKIVIIYSIIVILSLFSFTNFFDNEENFLLSKNINLGLDLQGGSYLLLEVDSQPVIKQKLQIDNAPDNLSGDGCKNGMNFEIKVSLGCEDGKFNFGGEPSDILSPYSVQ